MRLKRPRRTAPPSLNAPKRSVPQQANPSLSRRHAWMLACLIGVGLVLVGRLIALQITDRDFLNAQGNARLLRTLTIPAHRGLLLDRNGQPLAVSAPVQSVWINPRQIDGARAQWPALMALFDKHASDLETLLVDRRQREFVYLKRHIEPGLAAQVAALNLPGVYQQSEYRRYYPAAEATAHALGFTNLDDEGQEGLELLLNSRLAGVAGSRRVVQDAQGRPISLVAETQTARAGADIRLSLDQRLSVLAYNSLHQAVQTHQAVAGSAVVLDAHSGEVLAMVSQPGYNPNNRDDRNSAHYRNRVVTDVFEPGSTFKPFTIAAALKSGQFSPASLIDTGTGQLKLGQFEIKDARAYGRIDLSTIIQKSSNVGAAKLALKLDPEQHWDLLYLAGFGNHTGSGFPGEVSGHLPYFSDWRSVHQASLGFGYGLNVSLLQLARGYTLFANDGILPPLRFETINCLEGNCPGKVAVGLRVISPAQAQAILRMLESVVLPGGTGREAAVPGYRVGGKTGTVRKAAQGSYAANSYLSLFVGIAPLSAPRLVIAVMIDEPSGAQYYGGQVAAPVFAEIAAGALRLLNIAPDAL